MPRGDGTGPAGAGAMTGRGAGLCAGNDVPGFRGGLFGMGMGMGMRGGAGRGRGFWGQGGGRGNRRSGFGAGWGNAAVDAPAVNMKDVLENRAKALEQELLAVKERLTSIDNS